MGCSGRCEVQIYDFDFSGAQLNQVSPDQASYQPCKRPSDEDIAAALSAILARWQDAPSDTRGCQGEDCICVPSEPPAEAWTVWVRYHFEKAVRFQSGTTEVVGADAGVIGVPKPCEWEISGQFWVSSATTAGNCMSKPDTIQRPRNPKRPLKTKIGSAQGGG